MDVEILLFMHKRILLQERWTTAQLMTIFH